jgi:uncharacterized protein involved in cysteine biosynthesis
MMKQESYYAESYFLLFLKLLFPLLAGVVLWGIIFAGLYWITDSWIRSLIGCVLVCIGLLATFSYMLFNAPSEEELYSQTKKAA